MTEDAARMLAGILDEIIPPSEDGRFPGAGELGIAGFVEESLRQKPELRPVIVQGLAAVAELAGQRAEGGFSALARDERLAVLDEVAATQPAFLPNLMLHTYVGYYMNDRVLLALGLEARPPYPKGYAVEPTDFAILDPVRRRGKLYRDC